jgi:Flp pilus assembly protein TadG
MKKRLFLDHSRGQSLVFVAVISVALFAMLALALDFGYSMYNRRWAQNAADSAALAAARILCKDSSANRYLNAANEARNYAETYNRVFGAIAQTMTEICIYGDPNAAAGCASYSLDKGQARVVVDIQHPTFIASFFGTSSINVPATATAGCFAPGGVQGAAVIPVAWKCDQVICTTLPNGDQECNCDGLQYIPGDATCTLGVHPMVIFFNQDTGSNYYWCGDTNYDSGGEWGPSPLVGGVPDPAAIVIDCDAPGGPNPEVYPISPINPDHKWFWVNTDGDNCDATEEKQIVRYGLSTTMYTHIWYPECTGSMGTVYDNVDDYRDNTRVIVPVFDRQCQIADPLPNHGASCYAGPSVELTPPDTVTDGRVGSTGNSQTNWYHMTGAAVLDITCVEDPNSKCNNATIHARQWLEDRNREPTPPHKSLVKDTEISFEGCFVDGYVPGLIGRPSDGVVSGAWTLYLVK